MNTSPRLMPGPLGLGYALAGFVASIACALLPAILTHGSTAPWMLPVQFVLFIVVGALIVRLARRQAYQPSDLGLTVPPGASSWLLGAAGGLLFVVIGQVGARLISSISESSNQVASAIGFGESLSRDLSLALTVAMIGPVGEEVIFRGLIFRGLFDGLARRRVPRGAAFGVAALVSAVLFSQSHGGQGQDKQFWFLIVFGLIAAGLYYWTGSLVVAAFGHCVCNAVNVMLLLKASPPTTPLIWVLAAIAPLLGVAVLLGLRRLLGRGSLAHT